MLLLKEINKLINSKDQDNKGKSSLYQNIFDGESNYELLTAIIRLLSNSVHLYPKAQNFILNENFLYLVLSFTYIDEKNPLMKEWTIVLIRNLTESYNNFLY